MKVRDIIVENTGTIDQQAVEYFRKKGTSKENQDKFRTWLKLGQGKINPETQKPYTDFNTAMVAFNDWVNKQAPASVTQPEKQRSANFRGNQYTGGIPGERKGVISKVSQKVSRAVQQGKQTARAAGDKTQSYMDKLSRISNIGVTR